jgi:hypothetical protein
MFQQPSAGGDRVNLTEVLGSLALIYVRELREGVPTPYGESDAVAVDLHFLDGPKGGEIFENTLLFQRAIVGSLRSASHSDPVLARIGQGIAKPGQSAPFVLLPFTDADAALATGYIERRPKPFQAPATPTAAAPAAAATPSPATTAAQGSPASVDLSTLPPEVVALLQQNGAITAA